MIRNLRAFILARHSMRGPLRRGLGRWLLAIGLSLVAGATAAAAPAAKRPNFLVIVADDLGFSDLGAFGGEIDTPNLDRLALSGLRLTGFHTAAACAPTRAMLFTGSDSHRVGLGNMPESMQTNQIGQVGYEGHLRADNATLAERLSAAGYRTLFSGKWHLGTAPDQDPHARGFQQSFAMLHCCHNHFGLGATDDPTKMPGYRENGVTVSRLPADFYSSRFFAAKLVEQLTSSKDGPDGRKPFFAYLAFTAPHAPLQAPPETIAKYKGRYDAGFEVRRAQRLARQRALGLLDPAVEPHRVVDAPAWDQLTADQKQVAARKMEIYAAMVDELDQAVGRVVQTLKDTGEFDDTVIIFLSDNGAEGREDARTPDPPGPGPKFDAMGTAQSYVNYGPAWAQVATAPSWRFKTFASEGGIRTPAFIAGPIVSKKGAVAGVYTNVTDIVPTVVELAGAPLEPGRFAGRQVQPVDGISWTALLKTGAPVYPADRAVGAELFGSRALRQGDWKITDIGDGRWRLFNMAADPGENRDLSEAEPARKAALLKAWDAYARDVHVVMPDPPLQPTPRKAPE
ncbi:arylsulfatase [Phenylobacterium sp. LjRoot225]|uniref:arylsulfatase n=1 Tax=Phenylobacterium sp. LjRoot225 TaxID=3342285 RepID=UPI003ECED41E